MLKVSVIIPCYNVEKYLYRCVQSVITQTYPNIEIICVDDGSSDNTSQVIEKLQHTFPDQIKYLQQNHQGANSARNKGLTIASGFYYQFLDADDELAHEKIENQVNLSKKHSYPDLIIGSYLQFNELGQEIKKRIYLREEAENKWEKLMKTDLGNTCSNLFKSSIFKEISWNENLNSSQEYNLLFQILRLEKVIIFDPLPLTKIHQRSSDSISSTSMVDRKKNYAHLRKDVINYLNSYDKSLISETIITSFLSSVEMLLPFDQKEADRLIDCLSTSQCRKYIKSKKQFYFTLLGKSFGAKNAIKFQLKVKFNRIKFASTKR
jgi:glycosyltransferase involved in cell wall biosynthesis